MAESCCPICFDELKQDNVCKLDCGHTFHYECIISWFKNKKGKHPNSLYGKSIRVCPYCRNKVGYIDLPENTFPIKLIHKEFTLIEEFIQKEQFNKLVKLIHSFYKPKCCKVILEKGASSGQQCKKNVFEGSDYCKIHHKKYGNLRVLSNDNSLSECKFYPVLNFPGLNYTNQQKLKQFINSNTYYTYTDT
jgi:hypothetical protein